MPLDKWDPHVPCIDTIQRVCLLLQTIGRIAKLLRRRNAAASFNIQITGYSINIKPKIARDDAGNEAQNR